MNTHVHILGIGGTFMAGLALLAKESGYTVTGQDMNLYAPMSDMLAQAGIDVTESYGAVPGKPDACIVGNALRRGVPAVESTLDAGIPYTSGPEWLARNILAPQCVLAVSGTHGKTTTSSMLAWILERAGLKPGFLIGGVPNDFDRSAQLGAGSVFVIEADEYDTAFFDKRPKFLHYRPKHLLINNLEFDHADIYGNLGEIQRQFQYLLRTVPASGSVVYPQDDVNVQAVMHEACYSRRVAWGHPHWSARLLAADGSRFAIVHQDQAIAEVSWSLLGEHNVNNALAAILMAIEVGVSVETAVAALSTFGGVQRRLQTCGHLNGAQVYDDFAHHPTAIEKTIRGLRQRIGQARLIAVVDFASRTMQDGYHADALPAALEQASEVLFVGPEQGRWQSKAFFDSTPHLAHVFLDKEKLFQYLSDHVSGTDHVLLMSSRSWPFKQNLQGAYLTNPDDRSCI